MEDGIKKMEASKRKSTFREALNTITPEKLAENPENLKVLLGSILQTMGLYNKPIDEDLNRVVYRYSLGGTLPTLYKPVYNGKSIQNSNTLNVAENKSKKVIDKTKVCRSLCKWFRKIQSKDQDKSRHSSKDSKIQEANFIRLQQLADNVESTAIVFNKRIDHIEKELISITEYITDV
ncbi:uncharacterized protein LOC111613638 [Centruroides sculpturatus]|uniref:uncharacterized protein LOC111613638 n=1 Tax=Centruroides sculpturatus TaxID=218467 RepID=UPI000C6EAFB2|nr:uncharacterized protein LOC111613638 [Centruroides sculpturatus]